MLKSTCGCSTHISKSSLQQAESEAVTPPEQEAIVFSVGISSLPFVAIMDSSDQ